MTKKDYIIPVWMKMIRIIGDYTTKLDQKTISRIINLSHPDTNMNLHFMEREGLIHIIKIQNSGDISLTSRGRIIWTHLKEIEKTIGINMVNNND